ncbi:MAG: hypothetical protein RL701_283 [Pseudomonadota bacterium]|jgi:two-component system CheB/CheR fusion protein
MTFDAEVVVLDLGMPGLDGYGVAAELQRRLSDKTPPLIALTGYGQPDDVQRTKVAGFSAHCVKPVAVAQLLAAIEQLCGV